MQKQDVVVIGGGPAGYVAAIKAKMKGASVTLIEEREFGGVCLNRGCIPTKTLVDTSKILDQIPDGKKRGIVYGGSCNINMKTVLEYKTRMTRRMSAGVGSLLRKHGVETMSGRGIVSTGLVVTLADQEPIQAKKVIIATGTVPSKLPIPGLEDPRVLTTDDILNLDFLPPRLVILGAGVAGMEFAGIFRIFGSDVHVVEVLDRSCVFLDKELTDALERSLVDRDVKFSFCAKLEKVESRGESLVLYFEDGQMIDASHLLVSVGRKPNLQAVESFDLETTRGYLTVNEWMQTSHPDIYAVGDVNGRCMLAHAAYRMGEIAAAHAVSALNYGIPEKAPDFCVEHIPGGIYSNPEIGYVGLTEEEAKKRHEKILVGRFLLAANGRAVTAGHPEGFVKVVADAETEKIVGVHIFGLYASELANEAAVAVACGMTIREWGSVIHAHPTLSEALAEAAADALKLSPHLPPKE